MRAPPMIFVKSEFRMARLVCPVAIFFLAAAAAVGVAPRIDSISPAQGPIAGGTVVTISGSGFTPDTAVQFNRKRRNQRPGSQPLAGSGDDAPAGGRAFRHVPGRGSPVQRLRRNLHRVPLPASDTRRDPTRRRHHHRRGGQLCRGRSPGDTSHKPSWKLRPQRSMPRAISVASELG